MFERPVVSDVFKVLAVEVTGGVLSSPALLPRFGPLHRPTRKHERVLSLLRLRAQSVLVVLAQFEPCHFRRDA